VVADHAAGIDIDAFAGGEVALDHAAAGMDEHPAVAFELLHDETLAAEQAGEDLASAGGCRPARRARRPGSCPSGR
jgi:hypothetical protein